MSDSEKFLQFKLIRLSSDLDHALSIAYEPGTLNTPLIVFMNGLLLPSSSFRPAVEQFIELVKSDQGESRLPGILLWDRYGQGLSDKQEKTHDAHDVVETLHELLTHIAGHDEEDRPIIFVANSIGCPLARMYAEKYPSCIRAFLFLDSMMASSDFVSIFNEPQDNEEASRLLPEEREGLRIGREKMRAIFHPSVTNAEGFDRSRLPEQVPFCDRPKFQDDPFLTVMGHDHAFFAADTEEKLGINAFVVDKYMNAEWDKYNQGLLKLTKPDHARGTIRPKNASHFIQISNPDVVAQELHLLYEKVLKAESD
ncbi:uncharacterized protein FA14DRAFT_52808 [Meira miltonrushii]|uniref:AB hydrolase-1 domain-containing protein n=1 Tax=Meira miltonrushii TaxID=1280837 RepID=A0A316VF01_9BASI|nr:uncharacterized protein FA14DRAFT_52808 [Meira miltonrushii]PWN36207.1 hypothetical protein FA14DRAFT_52808 [Meira miltonrushii]